MQEISLMKKSINCFMNEMVVKENYTRSTSYFSPLINQQVPCKTRKLVCIVQIFVKQKDKPYVLYNCESPDVNSLEYSTWVIKVEIAINNTCQLALDYWDTNHKWFCL